MQQRISKGKSQLAVTDRQSSHPDSEGGRTELELEVEVGGTVFLRRRGIDRPRPKVKEGRRKRQDPT
jgi:hypothetical protein